MFIDRAKQARFGGIHTPKLHGHTKITLTDAKTGEVEIHEKDNLVTDAVDLLYAANLYGVMDYNDLKPVKDLFGGVMCFDTASDVNSITPERTNRLVGNAGQTAHSSASTKRGNPNGGESGASADGLSYKYVFDFQTNQCNGTINSLSLCHKNAGDVSIAPDVFVASIPLIKFSTNQKLITTSGNNSQRIPHTQRLLDLFYLHPTGNWGYHSAGTTISKISTQAIEQRINGVLGESEVIETKTFTIPNFTVFRDSVTYDVENDLILFITTPTNASVVVYSVDFDDETITTTTFDQGISVWQDASLWDDNTDTEQIVSCNKYVKSGKYIFVPSNGGSFYRLNMTDTTDIVELTSNMTDSLDLRTLGQVNINEGVVMGYNYIIDNDVVSQIAPPTYLEIMLTSNNHGKDTLRVVRTGSVDVANMAWAHCQTSGTASATFYVGVALTLPYLATIQNLNTPIIKTSERTMKIEYTITNSINI